MSETFALNCGVVSTHPAITLSCAPNREVLRITSDGRLILGEGLSQDEATQNAAKALIAAFELQIDAMLAAREGVK